MAVLVVNAAGGDFSLLAGAQTFIGVIISLVVLCLFESRSEDKQESSNFIRRISDELWKTFPVIVTRFLHKLERRLKEDGSILEELIALRKLNNPSRLVDFYKYVGLQMDTTQKFFNESYDKIKSLEQDAHSINSVDYVSQGQRLILIVCVAVMSLDALSFKSPQWIAFLDSFSGPFLFTLALCSFLICILLWNQKSQVIVYKRNKPTKAGKLSQHYWLRMPLVMVSVFAMTALFFLYGFVAKADLWLILLLLSLGLYLYFVKMRLFKNLPVERKNSSFPLKHAAYAILVSALVGAASFLLDVYCAFPRLHMVWIENNHTSRNMFVFVMAFCSILWPLYQEYLYFLIYTRETKKELRKEYNNSKKLIDDFRMKRESLLKTEKCKVAVSQKSL